MSPQMIFAGPTHRMARGILCLVAIAAGSAHAQSRAVQRYLTAAARLYENLEYERALEQLGRAKSLPRELNDDVSIALYEGAILADMGKTEESNAAFKTGLLLKPDAQLPVQVSPKVEREFEKIRAAVEKELAPILAKQEAERKKQSDRPEQPKPQQTSLQPSYPKPEVKIAGQQGASFQQVLPYGLAGVAALAGGVGGYFGFDSRRHVNAARSASSQDSATNELNRANSDAKIANLLFAVATAAAAGGLISFLLQGGDSASSPQPSLAK